MKTFRVLVTTALFVLVPALAAYAANLFTPLLTATGGDIVCSITNVGTSTETVTIEVINAGSGLPLGASLTIPPNPFTTSFLPGQSFSVAYLNAATAVYCKFTVPDKLSGNFRTVIWILNPTTATVTVALPGF